MRTVRICKISKENFTHGQLHDKENLVIGLKNCHKFDNTSFCVAPTMFPKLVPPDDLYYYYSAFWALPPLNIQN